MDNRYNIPRRTAGKAAIYTGTNTAKFAGFTPEMVGPEDFIIISYGRDGQDEGFIFDPHDPEKGAFVIEAITDYAKDLVNWNANWIRSPQVK